MKLYIKHLNNNKKINLCHHFIERESPFSSPLHTHSLTTSSPLYESPGEVEILDKMGLKLQALICLTLLFPVYPFSPTEQININNNK